MAFVLVLALLSAGPTAFTQVVQRDLVDSLLALDDRSEYSTLRQVLRPIRYDSVSLEYLRQRARDLDNCSAEAYANNQLGKMQRNASRFGRALAFHDEALRLGVRCQDTSTITAAHNGRGVVFRRQDMVTAALDAHEAARAIARRVATPTEQITYELGVAVNSLGNIYLAMEQWPEAEREFRESMRLQAPLGNDLGMAINYHNLGYAVEQQGMVDTALAYYQQSLAYNEKIDSDIGRVLCYVSIADIYAARGQIEDAYRLASQANTLSDDVADPFYMATARISFGDMLARRGELNRAARMLEDGLAIARDKNFLFERSRAHRLLAQTDSLRGDYLGALSHYHAAQQAERQLLSETNQRYVSDLSAKLQTERQATEIDRLAQENELVRERARRDRLIFYGIGLAIALLAGMLFVLYRQRSIIDDRDRAHLEQQRLASQMNPHFLFNALNSIKAFLIDNERSAAISYLDTFARLVRRILNSSINETVLLSEELDNCRLYVRIENARLNDEIEFELNVDPAIALDDHVVPPLLLQPFLENAFWHGLQPKKGEKQLRLSVEPLSDAGVQIRITDNGIGREQAELNKRNRVHTRKSVGIDITRQRLAHFAKEAGVTARFYTNDLVAADGSPLGTEVVITIG